MSSKKRSSESHKQASGSEPQGDQGDVQATPNRKEKRTTPNVPDPASDEFAFLVAGYAWRDGMTANAIVRRLGMASEPKYLMQVKRALRRAHGRFLKLVPPEATQLQEDLNTLVNLRENRRNRIRFHVVDDKWGPAFGSVCARAAELVSQIILEATRCPVERLHTTQPPSNPPGDGQREPDVVICNAGGRTVSEVVRVLQRNPPLLGESEERAPQLKDSLIFVAGNAAYLPERFHHSANFLSVTMAEVFGARHLALPKVEDEGFPDQYQNLVDRASLFICGVGTLDTGLMGKYFKDRDWVIPKRAVGDIAFNLVDNTGDGVELSESARRFMNQVNPVLNLPKIMHIAANRRVVLVLDCEEPEVKTEIGVASLKRDYTTDVVLGSRLARAILRAY